MISQKIAASAALERDRLTAEREDARLKRERFQADKLVLLAQIVSVLDEQVTKFDEFEQALQHHRLGHKGVDAYILEKPLREAVAMGNLLVPRLARTLNTLRDSQQGFALGYQNNNSTLIQQGRDTFTRSRGDFLRMAQESLGTDES